MGDCVKSLAEVKVDNIHGSPFVYPASLSQQWKSVWDLDNVVTVFTIDMYEAHCTYCQERFLNVRNAF